MGELGLSPLRRFVKRDVKRDRRRRHNHVLHFGSGHLYLPEHEPRRDHHDVYRVLHSGDVERLVGRILHHQLRQLVEVERLLEPGSAEAAQCRLG